MQIPIASPPIASSNEWAQLDTTPQIGRRSAPRLRLSIPARLVTLHDTRRCILINLSRTGAQVGLERPMRKDEGAILQLAGLDQFAIIVRQGVGPNGGVNGLEFECALSDEEVIAVRHLAESFAADEERVLRREVQAWVQGAT